MADDAVSMPIGASSWARDLYTFLTDHVRLEGDMLREYVAEAEATDSKALAYLIALLIEDERRHHLQFNELAASLKSDVELSPDDPAIPRLDLDRVDRDELLASTKQLLEHERSDLAELKRLRRELRDVQDTTLWALLVDIMMHDTEKHISILRFVEQHAGPRTSTR